MNEKCGIEFDKAAKGIITALEIVIVSENAEMASLWNMVFLRRKAIYLILNLSKITAT